MNNISNDTIKQTGTLECYTPNGSDPQMFEFFKIRFLQDRVEIVLQGSETIMNFPLAWCIITVESK